MADETQNTDEAPKAPPQKDRCALCGKESPYTAQTHIDFRIGYIEGAGQTCFEPHKCNIKP